MHNTVGILLYCKFLYHVVYILYVAIHLVIKERELLQSDPVKFMPNPV